MNARAVLTKSLAVAGTILVWLPIIAPIVFSLARPGRPGGLRFDFLMPAELFPAALVGGVVLLVAAILARSHRALIGWSLGAAVGLLVVGMALAVVTGLASGASEPTGWRVVLVTSSIVGYVVALIVLGAGGVSLLRRLFAAPQLRPPAAEES